MKQSLLLFFFILFSQLLQAQIVTERPGNSDSPVVIPKGAIQLETGIQANYIDAAENYLTIPNIQMRVSISQSIEVRLLTSLEKQSLAMTNTKNYEMSDLNLSTKFWLGEWERSNLAVIAYFGVPSGNNSSGNYFYQLRGSYGYSLSENVGLLSNFAYIYDGEDGDIFYTALINKSAGKAGFFAELYGNSNDLFADTGITYLVQDWFQLDLSFGIGISQKASNYLAIGASWLFKSKQ